MALDVDPEVVDPADLTVSNGTAEVVREAGGLVADVTAPPDGLCLLRLPTR